MAYCTKLIKDYENQLGLSDFYLHLIDDAKEQLARHAKAMNKLVVDKEAEEDARYDRALAARNGAPSYAHMGGLNRFQEEAVRYYVKDQLVYDLGAGLLGWAEKLVQFGAEHVTAVDELYKYQRENVLNNCRAWSKCAPTDVTIDDRSFREFHLTGPNALHTAFISWPHNTFGKTMGLELLAMKAKTVIYLGKNLDGTACGSPQLWAQLIRRKVLCFLPSARNSLIVYGPELDRPRRDLLREEKGAIEGPWDSILYTPPDWPAQ